MSPDRSGRSVADARRDALSRWVRQQTLARGLPAPAALAVVSGDASFRRYFRAAFADRPSLIAVDAPPARENAALFVERAEWLRAAGLRVPQIYAADLAQGFLLLEDFGDRLLLAELYAPQTDHWYGKAMRIAGQLQAIDPSVLPPYDAARYRMELGFAPQWLVNVHLQLPAMPSAYATLSEQLIADLQAQPVVATHRDFHARNLMICDDGELAVIDFQDALAGARSYDLISLLKDCYIRWPRARVLDWVEQFRQHYWRDWTPAQAQYFAERTALERHLKVIGQFPRLWHRDGKRGYLADLPRVLDYVIEACALFADSREVGEFFRDEVQPRLASANAEAEAGWRADLPAENP